MNHTIRTTVVAVTAGVIAGATFAAIGADAAGPGAQGGPGGPGRGGQGGSSGSGFVLTADTTKALDTADADLDAIGGAWTRRTDAGLIELSLGAVKPSRNDPASGASGSSAPAGSRALVGGFTLASDVASTSWTGFVVDRTAGTITADVDGTEDVVVLTFTPKTTTSSDSSTSTGTAPTATELRLTAAAAATLDKVVGSDAFDTGEVLATAGAGKK